MILPNRITIYIPHPPDKPDHYTLPAQVAELLTDAAGGATITEGTGYWKNDEGQLIMEPVALVAAWYADANMGKVQRATAQASGLLFAQGEQVVAVETGVGLHLLDRVPA